VCEIPAAWADQRAFDDREFAGAHPSEDLHRQSIQQRGDARGVVAGVGDDQDVAVALLPPPPCR